MHYKIHRPATFVFTLLAAIAFSFASVGDQDQSAAGQRKIDLKQVLSLINDLPEIDALDQVRDSQLTFVWTPESEQMIRLTCKKSQWQQKSIDELMELVKSGQPRAIISVQCNTACSVLLDGKVIGSAAPGKDLTLAPLPAGKPVFLEATAKGHTPATRQFTPIAGTNPVIHFSLVSETGALQVLTEPAICEVAVDGYPMQRAQKGQVAFSDLRPGKYSVRISNDGYRTVTRNNVEVIAGEIARLYVALEPNTGRLKVTCEPVDCEISIDSRQKLTTSNRVLAIDLECKTYSLVVSSSGYQNMKRPAIEIVPGKELAVKVVLVSEAVLANVRENFRAEKISQSGYQARLSYALTSSRLHESGMITETAKGFNISWKKDLPPDLADNIQKLSKINIYAILEQLQSHPESAEWEARDNDNVQLAIGESSERRQVILTRLGNNWYPSRFTFGDDTYTITVEAPVDENSSVYEAVKDYLVPGRMIITDSRDPQFRLNLSRR